MAIKADMEKMYERVERPSIKKCLSAFGISEKLAKLNNAMHCRKWLFYFNEWYPR